MSEEARGKSGTIKMDPGATVPEVRPLRFADDVAAADRADLANDAPTPPLRPQQPVLPESERQESLTTTARKPVGRTLELRSVDVSRADPRQAPTQVALRTLEVDSSLGPSSQVEGEPSSKRWSLVLGVALAVLMLGVLALVLGGRILR